MLTVAFPEGGYAPFPFTAYAAIPVFCAVAFAVLPRGEHTLRVGLVLYALGSTLALVVHTAMGGNATRLGASRLACRPCRAAARAVRLPPGRDRRVVA